MSRDLDALLGGISIGMLIFLAVYYVSKPAKVKAQAQAAPLFECHMPIVEGDITTITIDVRDGKLVGACHYLTTRPSKP